MDHDLCQHGKPWPCPYCVFDRLVERYDTRDDALYNALEEGEGNELG